MKTNSRKFRQKTQSVSRLVSFLDIGVREKSKGQKEKVRPYLLHHKNDNCHPWIPLRPPGSIKSNKSTEVH